MLTNELNEKNPLVEICLGCEDNHRSAFFEEEVVQDHCFVMANTTNVLNHKTHKNFWFHFANTIVSIGREDERYPFLVWQQKDEISVKYLGIHTGLGKGSWVFKGNKHCENLFYILKQKIEKDIATVQIHRFRWYWMLVTSC